MNGKRLLPLLSVLYLVSFPAAGQQPEITLHSTVSGNREQPKVMYILPWQQPGVPYIEQRFNVQLTNDLFFPLDREEFVRELNYQAMADMAQDSRGDEQTEISLHTE